VGVQRLAGLLAALIEGGEGSGVEIAGQPSVPSFAGTGCGGDLHVVGPFVTGVVEQVVNTFREDDRRRRGDAHSGAAEAARPAVGRRRAT
jgi:hypothetical protein